MKLYKIRGGSIADLERRKYNIGIGISLGNRWFTTENTVGLIRWSLLHTRDWVVVYIADSIHAINIEVRNKISFEEASQIADNEGRKLLSGIQEGVKKMFTPEEQRRIHFAKWSDFENEDYRRKKDYLYSLYEKDESFKSYIHAIVKDFVSKGKRSFSDKEINRLGTYILEELPELICRVPIKSMVYDANAYPFDSKVTELAEDIQLGNIFPEVRKNILDTEPKVFLEVR